MLDYVNGFVLLQVDVILSDGTFARAAVPSGASTGMLHLFI